MVSNILSYTVTELCGAPAKQFFRAGDQGLETSLTRIKAFIKKEKGAVSNWQASAMLVGKGGAEVHLLGLVSLLTNSDNRVFGVMCVGIGVMRGTRWKDSFEETWPMMALKGHGHGVSGGHAHAHASHAAHAALRHAIATPLLPSSKSLTNTNANAKQPPMSVGVPKQVPVRSA